MKRSAHSSGKSSVLDKVECMELVKIKSYQCHYHTSWASRSGINEGWTDQKNTSQEYGVQKCSEATNQKQHQNKTLLFLLHVKGGFVKAFSTRPSTLGQQLKSMPSSVKHYQLICIFFSLKISSCTYLVTSI